MVNRNRHDQDVKKHRFWEVHVEAWHRSGLSQNEYCRQNTLRSSQFGYWKKKLARQISTANFVPVPIPGQDPQFEAGNSSSGITICLKKERCIKVDNHFVRATLTKVLSVLENQP